MSNSRENRLAANASERWRINRRELFAASAAAAASASSLRAGDDAGFRLRHLLASSLYGQTPIGDVLPEVAATGSEAIDLWPKPHGAQREAVDAMGVEAFATMCRGAGVRVGCLTRYELGAAALSDEIGVARSLGATHVVANAKGTKPGGNVAAYAKTLYETIAAAESAGVTVCVENHSRTALHSADAVRRFRDAVRSPAVKIALAPAHLPQDAAAVATLVRDLGDRIGLFYAWQRGTGFMRKQPTGDDLSQLPGVGPLDFAPIVSALRDVAFDGWTSVFMHPVPRGVPAAGSVEETTSAVRSSLAYLRGLA